MQKDERHDKENKQMDEHVHVVFVQVLETNARFCAGQFARGRRGDWSEVK